jgi:SP family general alpha glucoside:H+ symporter-like MFS transporter
MIYDGDLRTQLHLLYGVVRCIWLTVIVQGTYVVVAPAYASEVCPVALRGLLTSYINLTFVMGQLIANGVIAGTSKLDTHWAYSGPFAAQWIWPLVILIGWPFAPESPW